MIDQPSRSELKIWARIHQKPQTSTFPTVKPYSRTRSPRVQSWARTSLKVKVMRPKVKVSHPSTLRIQSINLTCNSAAGSEANTLGAFLSFTGDVEDEAVDMFAEAEKAAEEEEQEEDPEAEPEDDFNAAWEVLDLARALFEKQKDESDEAKLKLADTYMCLGDVSLETGMSISLTRGFNI